MIEIRLPKPGPEIEEATITSWECAEGDKIRIGDILAIIKTPVGSFKVAAEEQGLLESILQHKGDSINFEEPIALLKPELTISNFKGEENTEEESLPFPEETEEEDEPEAPEDSWEEEVIDLPEEPEPEEDSFEEETEEDEEAPVFEAPEEPEEEESEEPEPIAEKQEAFAEEEETKEADDDSEPEDSEETIPFDTFEADDQVASEPWDEEPEDEQPGDEEPEEEAAPMEEPEEVSVEESAFPESLEFEISPAAMKLADQAGIDLNTVQGSGENGKIHFIDVENAIWERAKVNQAREQGEDTTPEEAEQAPDNALIDAETAGEEEEASQPVDSETLQEIDEGIYEEQSFEDEVSVETTPVEADTEPESPVDEEPELPQPEDKPLPAFDDVSIQYNIEQKDDLIIPFNTTKKNYAELMAESNQSVPQLVLFADIDFTNAGRWREVYNTENKTDISVTDIIVKTCGHALALMPEMNAYVRPDRIILKRSINIAVTTPVDEGVVAPVVPDVYHKPLYKVSEAIRKNTSLATQSKVVLDYDSAFTVSNLGMYGVKRFVPLVTPPQTACLAVGEIAKRVVPVKDFAGIREMVEVTLACDHRAVDGAAAAKFLQIVRNDIESMIPGEDPDWIKGNEQLRLI